MEGETGGNKKNFNVVPAGCLKVAINMTLDCVVCCFLYWHMFDLARTSFKP